MTLQVERFWAVAQAGRLLHDLLDPRKTPRVPASVRKQALRALRHYPTAYWLRTDGQRCLEHIRGHEPSLGAELADIQDYTDPAQ